MAMPLRGSFQELADLLREYALKYDDSEVGRAVEKALAARPTVEMLRRRARGGGLRLRRREPRVRRPSGSRAGATSSRTRWRACSSCPTRSSNLDLAEPDKAFDYVREAIDKYWSDGTFELTVHVGCATGRRLP